MKSIQILLVVCLLPLNLLAQITVKGTVYSKEDNSPLPGVSVFEKGTKNQTIADIDGKYEITVTSDTAILVFSFIGCEAKEIAVKGKKIIDCYLKNSEALVEEVVVSYGVGKSSLFKKMRNSRQVRRDKKMMKRLENPVIQHNTEEYDKIDFNEFQNAKQNPLSTLSIDVDNAAYSNIRRVLNNSQMPEPDMVRIEEMINYFNYDYLNPTDKHPFSINTEVSYAPWNKKHRLVHVGIQGKKLDYKNLKPSNLVFLIDVSGSMSSENKLPLLKKSFAMLLDKLSSKDRVAIVVYASASGVVLKSTSASEKEKILKSLNNLKAGGSTAGGEGIKLAYKIAKENFRKSGNNRVILATDGDFNVGTSSTSSLVRLIRKYQKDNIFLTICGFGMGNYKDGRMEQISNAGNGNYFYIDNIHEAQKVFVKEMRANMFTIAKDVKIQIEFNPAKVKSYRLIGYENRLLDDEDFNDDKKDAGELGAGHSVTALYEIIEAGSDEEIRKTDELKYQTTSINQNARLSNELMTIKFRYKKPDGNKSVLMEKALQGNVLTLDETSDNFRFSAAVAAFGMQLRKSKHKGNITYDEIKDLAKKAKGQDEEGYRAEFIRLVETAKLLK